MAKLSRSQVASMPDQKKVTVYAGGEIRTITAKTLKKNMGIKQAANPR